jgi:DNA-binding NarL/FixJ family response regulator
MSPTLIRAVIVDDHPAMRAGIAAVLDRAQDITLVGEAEGARELWPLLQRTDPDVVLMDFHLGEDDGILLCHRIKRAPASPRVVLYTAFGDTSLVAPAMLAQADALLAKRAPAREVYETLREVTSDGFTPPRDLAPEQRERLNAMLDPADLGLAGLLLLRVPPREIGRSLGPDAGDLQERTERLLLRVTAQRALLV